MLVLLFQVLTLAVALNLVQREGDIKRHLVQQFDLPFLIKYPCSEMHRVNAPQTSPWKSEREPAARLEPEMGGRLPCGIKTTAAVTLIAYKSLAFSNAPCRVAFPRRVFVGAEMQLTRHPGLISEISYRINPRCLAGRASLSTPDRWRRVRPPDGKLLRATRPSNGYADRLVHLAQYLIEPVGPSDFALYLLAFGDVPEIPDATVVSIIRSQHLRRVAVEDPSVRKEDFILACCLSVLVKVLNSLQKRLRIGGLSGHKLQDRFIGSFFDQIWREPHSSTNLRLYERMWFSSSTTRIPSSEASCCVDRRIFC